MDSYQFCSDPGSATQLAVATFITTGWYHFNATKAGQYLVFRGTLANHPNIYLWYATNILSCGFYGTDSSYHEVDYSFTPSTASDYYLSCSYSGSAISLYGNSSLVDSTCTSASPLTSGTQNLFIGGTAGGASFEGLGSANELYDVALSQGQIAALMAGGSPPSGLVGDWQLNEGTGSTATDSSTYGDNGTWNGTASGNYGYYEGPTTTTYTSGTVTPRQPGFDSTLANNTSAEFPWNGWSAAPNNTLGSSMEWNTPWSLMVQVDNLQWTRTGTLVLASKGDLASGNWWELYLQMAANTKGDAGVQLSQLCFARHSAFNNVGNGICTSAYGVDIMPNGFNYNIVVTDSGTGASGLYNTTSALDIYVNGLDKNTGAIAETPFTTSFQAGFGSAIVTYSGGGTGYANSTAFTSSGGGANCNIAGHMTASGRRSQRHSPRYLRLRLHRRPDIDTYFAHRHGNYSYCRGGHFDELHKLPADGPRICERRSLLRSRRSNQHADANLYRRVCGLPLRPEPDPDQRPLLLDEVLPGTYKQTRWQPPLRCWLQWMDARTSGIRRCCNS